MGAVAGPAEDQFCDLIGRSILAYRNASQAGGDPSLPTQLRDRRKQALRFLMGSGIVKGWTGVVTTVDPDGDGKGRLSVRLDCGATLRSSTASDRRDAGIPKGTYGYAILANLLPGNRIVFDGSFLVDADPGPDYVIEGSRSESDSMTAPGFLFAFTTLSPPVVQAQNVAQPAAAPALATAAPATAAPPAGAIAPAETSSPAAFPVPTPGSAPAVSASGSGSDRSVPPSQTFPTSFDCARATSAAEQLICATPELARADVELASYYRRNLAASNEATVGPAQRVFIAERNRCTTVRCIREAYRARHEELAAMGYVPE